MSKTWWVFSVEIFDHSLRQICSFNTETTKIVGPGPDYIVHSFNSFIWLLVITTLSCNFSATTPHTPQQPQVPARFFPGRRDELQCVSASPAAAPQTTPSHSYFNTDFMNAVQHLTKFFLFMLKV